MHPKKSHLLIVVFLLFSFIFPKHVMAMTLSGPITASTVTVSGDVTVSNLIANTLTVTNSLISPGTIDMPGRVMQVKVSSSSSGIFVDSTTFTAVPTLAQSITLSNANDYVRISLTGGLYSTLGPGTTGYLTIYRGATNLGDMTLGLSASFADSAVGNIYVLSPVGIALIDRPGDTNPHTYQVYIRGSNSTVASPFVLFPYGVGYLLLEEIRQL